MKIQLYIALYVMLYMCSVMASQGEVVKIKGVIVLGECETSGPSSLFYKSGIIKWQRFGIPYEENKSIKIRPVDSTRFPVEYNGNLWQKNWSQVVEPVIKPIICKKYPDQEEAVSMIASYSFPKHIPESLLLDENGNKHKNIELNFSVDTTLINMQFEVMYLSDLLHQDESTNTPIFGTKTKICIAMLCLALFGYLLNGKISF
jgi:hypothetical protein